MKTVEEITFLASSFEKGSSTVLFVCQKDMDAMKSVMEGLNANIAMSGNFGTFENSASMANQLGFTSIFIDGRTLHLSSNLNSFIERINGTNKII